MWIRLDDEYDDNAKIAEAGPLGQLLHVKAIVWSSRNLTDGVVPLARMQQLAWSCLAGVEKRPDPDALIDRLVDLRLLERNGDTALHIHDFLAYQPTREKVLAEREAARKRMQRVRGGGKK